MDLMLIHNTAHYVNALKEEEGVVVEELQHLPELQHLLELQLQEIAIKVGLFQRDWEVKITKHEEELKSKSPEEDLFGDVNVSIDDLEVFGTDTTKSDNGLNFAEGETLVQVDGGVDSDSDDASLVINEGGEELSPSRKSKRLQAKESQEKAKTNLDVSNPLNQDGKDEELDYEPDEEKDDIEQGSSDSSDSEVEDNDAAKALFMEKFKAGLTAKKVDFTETKDGLLNLPNLNKEKSKAMEESSTSSSESDDDSGQLLLQKKMLMLNAISSPGTNTQDEKRDKESSSESEDDEDAQQILLQKKMLIMQSNSGSVKPISSMNVGNSHLSDDILMKKESGVPSLGPAEQNEITSVVSETEPESHMEVDTEEVISPKKKPKVISDSEGEEDEMIHDPVGDKLTELGRENADRKKLKRKINIESKLKGMKALHEEKIQNQNLKTVEPNFCTVIVTVPSLQSNRWRVSLLFV